MFLNHDVENLRENLVGIIVRTPCVFSPALSSLSGAKVYLKLENMQRTGSFKERGAASFLLQKTKTPISHVVTASAGNHAQAVALHAARLHMQATIFMPETTPNTKVLATERLNATVILTGQSYDDAYLAAKDFSESTQAAYLHAYNDPHVILGQATVAFEIFEDLKDVDAIVVPVGGGGLMAGIAQYVANRQKKKRTTIIGVEAKGFASMALALNKSDAAIASNNTKTIAEGIAVKRAGELAVDILRNFDPRMIVVDDEHIQSAIMLLLERQKIVAEGAGAAPLAGFLHHDIRHSFRSKTVVLVISGGNIDINLLARLTAQELVKSSRLCRMSLVIKDIPGSLSALLQTVTKAHGNIMDIHHERSFASIAWNEVQIDVIIETKNETHEAFLLEALKNEGYVVKAYQPEASCAS
jgi:threonine dehydratase